MNENKWTIIACSNHKNEYLHLKYLKQSNPDAQIIKLNFGNKQRWKNEHLYHAHFECDAVIRDWFRFKPERVSRIKYNNIALVEYDTLITQRLPDIKLNNELLCNKKLIPKKNPNWNNWPHILKLEEWKEYAVGCMPFSLYFMSKNCLDIWIDEKYNDIYKHKMCAEVRLPSILNRNGVKIKRHSSLKNIKFIANKSLLFDMDVPGLYHPVKYSTQKASKIRPNLEQLPESDKNNKDSSN